MVELWRVQLGKVSEKAGQSLADPKDYPNLFPDFQAACQAEVMLRKERAQFIPAADYQEILVSLDLVYLLISPELTSELGLFAAMV